MLRGAVHDCRNCDLYRWATQAVPGEGSPTARLMLVGEEPGDYEDKQGHPFVGPGGRVLDRALADAAIDRSDVFLTNVVKHFKFEQRGKRRIHKKPAASEVAACLPWLEAEVAIVKPKVIVCLGATAAQALLGRAHRLTKERGNFVQHPWGPLVTSTIHPAAVLRAPTGEERRHAYRLFVEDLIKARQAVMPRMGAGGGAQRER